jgi:hypothetical protein
MSRSLHAGFGKTISCTATDEGIILYSSFGVRGRGGSPLGRPASFDSTWEYAFEANNQRQLSLLISMVVVGVEFNSRQVAFGDQKWEFYDTTGTRSTKFG